MIRRNLWMGLLILFVLASCKKNEIETTPLASLQVTNAVGDGSTLQFGTNAATIAGYSATAFGMLAGNRQVSLVATEAPNTIYYDKTHNFVNGGVYSLFLAGTSATETVFIKEKNIVSHTDNVFGIRVINLSVGKTPISVNLAGTASGSLIPSLAYKAISDFRSVSASSEEGTKTFEFRHAETGDLITAFDVPDYDLPRFRNITLVFVGLAGNELVFRVNNY